MSVVLIIYYFCHLWTASVFWSASYNSGLLRATLVSLEHLLRLSRAVQSCWMVFSVLWTTLVMFSTFFTFGLVWEVRPKKHKVNTYKERALSTVCTNGKMETKREIAPKNELVPISEFAHTSPLDYGAPG